MADDLLKLFEQTGAYLKGHFRLTSGLHSPEYLQCALVLRYPAHAETLGAALAKALTPLTGNRPIDVVVSPAMGGVITRLATKGGSARVFTDGGGLRHFNELRGNFYREGGFHSSSGTPARVDIMAE